MSEIRNIRISNINDLKDPWQVTIECDASSHEQLKRAVVEAADAIARAQHPNQWPKGRGSGINTGDGVKMGPSRNWTVRLKTPIEDQIAHHEREIERLRSQLEPGAEAGADDK